MSTSFTTLAPARHGANGSSQVPAALPPGNRRAAWEDRDRRLGMLLISPSILLLLVLIGYPLVQAVLISFFSIDTRTLAASWVGGGNYAAILASRDFWISLANNVVWTFGALSGQLLLGCAIALMLNQPMALRTLARSIVLLPYLIPTVVAVLVWQWLFNDLYGYLNFVLIGIGLTDAPVNWLGEMPNAMLTTILVGSWKFFPFVVITVLARLQTIPQQLYEAAMIDGANVWRRFLDVTLPQLRGVLVIVVLLRAIWDFKEFDLIYLLTGGGPVISTQTLPLMIYKEAFQLFNFGRASAVAVLMLLISFTGMYFYLRTAYKTHDRDDE
jgi:multiple sugar transport system permease protein